MKSVLENPQIALEKVENEIQLGRITGPFQYSPISNLRCSPIGVIPKKTSGWPLITHLSYPTFGSVNDFIDEKFTSVQYSTFIHWLVSQEHGSQNLDHYLDAFFFAGESNTDNCKRLMKTFDHVCARLVVPIAKEKTEGPMKNA